MKRETRDVWIADDGKSFATEAECATHEKAVLARKQALAKLKVWRVTHGFDETEGRGYFSKTLIVTDAEKPVLIQWCLDKFGPPLSPWYGGGFYEAWLLGTDGDTWTVDRALAEKGKVAWSNQSPTALSVVSKNDWSWAGLPASEFPWPRHKRVSA
jgi:hypothetical protein